MKYRYLSLLALALLIAVAGCPKRATIAESEPEADITVARDGSGDYKTIQKALDAASSGDVIYVRAGTYEEDVEIDDLDDIRLVGAGPGKAVIDADGEYAALTIESDDCTVSGFTLRGASSHGLYIKGSGQEVDHLLIIENGDRGIYFSSFDGSPSARIDHCTVADNDVSGIYIPSDNDETAITNCIVAFNGRGIVSDEAEGLMTVDRNCVFETDEAFDRVDEGKGNIEDDPEFVDREGGDYSLEKSSPAIGAGTGGSNMGCF